MTKQNNTDDYNCLFNLKELKLIRNILTDKKLLLRLNKIIQYIEYITYIKIIFTDI
jgi:hypothetical protein